MQMWWQQLWERRRATVLGIAAGLILGLLYLIVGFWDMLIFALIVYTGYYIGKKTDRDQPLFPEQDEWRRLLDKWRGFR